MDDYSYLHAEQNILRRRAAEIDQADELSKRRLMKRCILSCMVAVKIFCRRMGEYLRMDGATPSESRDARVACGKMILHLIQLADDRKLRFTPDELMTMLSIPQAEWDAQEVEGVTLMDVIFVRNLGEPLLVDYLQDAVIDEITSNSKVKRQVDTYIRMNSLLPI